MEKVWQTTRITEKYGTSVADDKTITQKYHRNMENWIN